MNQKEFKDFFEPYAKNVDNANSLAFWKLSDGLIMQIIKNNIPAPLSDKELILDAGGGTGRWICDLSKIYNTDFILYDLSEDMLEVAKRNIKKKNIENRVKVFNGSLIDMREISDNSVDYVVSVYSPISFVYQKEKAVGELFRILKKGGRMIIMGHGYYNAIASKINNYTAPANELESLLTESMVKWGSHVPKLNVFSQESMEKMLEDAGFKVISTYGVPVFVQPGPEDWDLNNSKKSRISTALQEKSFFDEVFEIEMKYNHNPKISNRGMNIFTVVEK